MNEKNNFSDNTVIVHIDLMIQDYGEIYDWLDENNIHLVSHSTWTLPVDDNYDYNNTLPSWGEFVFYCAEDAHAFRLVHAHIN